MKMVAKCFFNVLGLFVVVVVVVEVWVSPHVKTEMSVIIGILVRRRGVVGESVVLI